MTESAEKRSKRVFLKHFNEYEWTCQLTLFYPDYLDSLNTFEHSKVLRKAIIRAFPEQAFLYRHCSRFYPVAQLTSPPVTEKKYVVMPYLTFFTNKKIMTEAFADFVKGMLGIPVHIKKRNLKDSKKASYSSTVKNQRPHNLHNLHKFPNAPSKINRFSFLNKKQASSKWNIGDRIPDVRKFLDETDELCS